MLDKTGNIEGTVFRKESKENKDGNTAARLESAKAPQKIKQNNKINQMIKNLSEDKTLNLSKILNNIIKKDDSELNTKEIQFKGNLKTKKS